MRQTRRTTRWRYVVCIQNTGYAASLEPRKIYRALPDPQADEINMLRVIDESGEDYLYPVDLFVTIDLPKDAQSAFAVAS